MEKYHFENEVTDVSFKEQFSRRETIKTEGGNVETIDINPDAPGTPFFLAPAWGSTLNVYGPSIEYLSRGAGWDDEDGLETQEIKDDDVKNRVISLDQARSGGSGISPEE